jgi:hypothetical protein
MTDHGTEENAIKALIYKEKSNGYGFARIGGGARSVGIIASPP